MFQRWMQGKSINLKIVRDGVPVSEKEASDELIQSVEAAYLYGEIAKDVVKSVAISIAGAWCIYKIVERICR